MPSLPPLGDRAPADGALPAEHQSGVSERGMSVYLHVPFCASRCGYCDFNTYTADQLAGFGTRQYLAAAHAEIELARRVLGPDIPPLRTVFVGGGTPTLLSPQALGELLSAIKQTFGLSPGAEITIEANPETITPQLLDGLLTSGFTRLSVGMQSADATVLQVLDRVHTPGAALRAVELAKQAGFVDVNLDLIYGTPGESMAQWQGSLATALSVQPTHISAYALIVEEGTRLAHRIRRGELMMPDDDDLADKYVVADEMLAAAGFSAYEISNWSLGDQYRCQHNLAYWRSDNWWGIGPGAHSHLNGVRWWNHRLPRTWGAELSAGRSPAQAREIIDDATRHIERVLLELRIADGLPLSELTVTERERVPGFVERNLLYHDGDRLRLTRQGRLLADAVTRDLLD